MKLILTSAAAALLMLGATAASAQGPGAAMRQACAADMQKFCSDKTGPDRRQCMMAHREDLSDGCKSAIKAAMEKREEMKAEKPQ